VTRRLGLALLILTVTLWAASAAQAGGTRTGDLVLRLGAGGSTARAAQLAGLVGGRLVSSLPQLGAFLVELPEGAPPLPDALDRLRSEAGVRSAVRLHELHIFETAPLAAASDPLQSSQWHLGKISAPTAWAAAASADNVVIAIVDTGVDYTHPDLAGKVTLGPDIAEADSDPMDTQGHGTHVAGIAAAVAGNGVGGSGVCPSCRLLAVKVFPDGSGSASDYDVAQGIIWAADNGADVVNLSLGGPGGSTTLRDAVDYAWSRGVVVVAAAGNSGNGTTQYPAAYPNAIAVAATTSYDTRASFSTYGSWVDIAAPGSSILSTVRGGSYQAWSGTSMAAPVVAGAAGLAFAGLAGATSISVRAALERAVVDLAPSGRDPYFGAGRLDLSKLFGAPPPAAAPLAVTTASLPAAIAGQAYSATLNASGGVPPYSWSLVSGSLPDGLVLGTSGTFAGTPTAAGSFAFSVRAADAAGASVTRTFWLSVATAPAPPPPSPPPSQIDLSGAWLLASRGSTGVTGVFSLRASGGGVAPQATVRFTLFTSAGAQVGQTSLTVTSLAAGQTRTLMAQWAVASLPGMTVRAEIDPAGQVTESNEANNTVTRAVS
jgi:thermitase